MTNVALAVFGWFLGLGGSLKRGAPLSLSNGLGMATLSGNIPKGFAFEAATPGKGCKNNYSYRKRQYDSRI